MSTNLRCQQKAVRAALKRGEKFMLESSLMSGGIQPLLFPYMATVIFRLFSHFSPSLK